MGSPMQRWKPLEWAAGMIEHETGEWVRLTDAQASLDAERAARVAAEAELSAGSFYKESDIDALQDKAARAERAEAEVARLTDALQRIAHNRETCVSLADARSIARAALEAKP